MPSEHANAQVRFFVKLQANHALDEHSTADDCFSVECYDAEERLVWQTDTAHVEVDPETQHLRIQQSED